MKLVLASHNEGKLKEFRHLFSTTSIHMLSLKEFCQEEAEETGLTFIENAILKARHGCEKTGSPCIADDSGLVVPALNGAPGIYSARYAGKHGDRQANVNKLLHELKNVSDENRAAYFVCVLVFMLNETDPSPIIAEGRLHGKIAYHEAGNQGYGYDPIMFLPDKNCTVAELSFEEKNQISHRAKAMKLLYEKLDTM